MNVKIETLWSQKLEAKPEHYEDASFPLSGIHSLDGLRITLADGASESFLSRHWAQHLAKKLSAPFTSLRSAWGPLRSSWPDVVQVYIQEREAGGRSIEWYEEPGLARGGYGTVLSVRFHQKPQQENKAQLLSCAVGDCCLFQLRGDKEFSPFPLTSPDQFDCAPELVFSSDEFSDLVAKRRCDLREVLPGDVLFFLSDALALWTFEQIQKGAKPLPLLSQFVPDNSERFLDWVRENKLSGSLRDDDITLVRATVMATGDDA